MTLEGSGKKGGRGVQRVLIVSAVVLAVLLVLLVLQAIHLLRPKEETPAPTAAPSPATALATPEDRLPVHLAVGREPPAAEIYDEANRATTPGQLAAESRKGIWIVFWASWCPDCTKQFEILQEMAEAAKEREIELILIDRLNPQKETRGAARKKLAETGVEVRCLYDENEQCYQAWGMREIPSAVVLNPAGKVAEYRAGTMNLSACKGMLDRALSGRDDPGKRYILQQFSNGEGGIITSTTSSTPPSGQDVLSESQGMMMQYAAAKRDRELFDAVWEYTRTRMMTGGLAAWYTEAKGGKAGVNATIDDLRIWDALRKAGALWGEAYEAAAAETREAIKGRCLDVNGRIVNFTEFESGRRADSVSLCTLDIEILTALAEADAGFAPALESAREILEKGRISDEFPLYYGSYSYTAGTYSREELNTAEAMYTLWNLARAGMLPEDTMAWLREKVLAGELAARYGTDGKATASYHSTAVYGLAALTARAAGDEETAEWAVRRMERMSVTEAEDPLYGAYCQKGATIHAFDQLIPLLVNEELAERTSL